VMPEGRTKCELGHGPPGGVPEGHNPKTKADLQERCIKRISVYDLYEMHQVSFKGVLDVQNQKALSVKESKFESHRTMCRRGMHERPDTVSNLKQRRTRLPANKEYQTRDLRHGCQGSVTITNPIMEE
jgi:hypothetical protein